MANAIHKLTSRQIESIGEPGRHSDGGNLYLNVTKTGAKSWVFVYRWQGRIREMGLGSAFSVTLKRARDMAAQARELLAQDIDPIAKKEATAIEAQAFARAKSVPSFGDAADALLAAIDGEFRNRKHAAQWKMTLGDYCESIREKAVNEVTTDDVYKILLPMWREKAETASRLRGRIERVIDAARALDPDKTRWGFNPASWKGNLEPLLGKRQKLQRGHHPSMPWREVPAFFQKVRQFESSSQMALAFLILTAARSGEVFGATWGEFDLPKAIWTIPGERMKAGKPHTVPLSDEAMAILSEMVKTAPALNERDVAYVFPGAKDKSPLSATALTMRMRKLGAGGFTAHGFRSSFRDWAGDATHYPRELAEQALAHVVGGVEGAYRRSDALEMRRAMMSDWGAFLGGRTVKRKASRAKTQN